MNEVNYTKLNTTQQNINPDYKKRLESQNSYTAIDKEQIKKDSAEIANKIKENAKENFIFRAMRSFGCEDPKKFIKTSILTATSMIAVMIIGNKISTPSVKLGNIVDDFLTSDKNLIGKTRNFAVKTLSSLTGGIKKVLPQPRLVKDIKTAFKKPYSIRWNLFRGYNNGGKGVFANTIRETLTTACTYDSAKVKTALESMLGSSKAEAILKDLNDASVSNIAFSNKLTKFISENQNCGTSTTKLREILEKIDTDAFGEGLSNITMDKSGFIGSWGPANIANNIIKFFTKKDCKILKGNLGDALIKYNAINGTMAKTLPAKIIQIVPTLFSEQYTNFVNDKSLFGLFLTANTFSIVKNIEEAPKEKKISTAISTTASGAISWLVSMPIISSIIYGAATLKKVPGKGPLHALTRFIGKPFAIGLDKTTPIGGVSGVAGGIFRLFLIMFVLQPIIGKQINKFCNKIFGEPYDALAEEKAAQAKAQAEAEANKVIPELGITQGEFIKKIQSNPKAVEQLQANPELVKKLQGNPRLLIDYLDGKDVTKVNTKPSSSANVTKTPISPINQALINSKRQNNTTSPTQIPQNMQAKTSNKAQTAANNITKSADTATYIPSSAAPSGMTNSTMSQDKAAQFNQAMTKADKALAQAEKYI